MRCINHTLALLSESARSRAVLRPSDVLVIASSQRLDDLAAEHQCALPVPVRTMPRGMGVTRSGRDVRCAALARYLLFEAPYTCALLALGEADAMVRRD